MKYMSLGESVNGTFILSLFYNFSHLNSSESVFEKMLAYLLLVTSHRYSQYLYLSKYLTFHKVKGESSLYLIKQYMKERIKLRKKIDLPVWPFIQCVRSLSNIFIFYLKKVKVHLLTFLSNILYLPLYTSKEFFGFGVRKKEEKRKE